MGMTLDLTQGQAQININGITKPSSPACEFCALKTQHIWNLDGGRVWLYAMRERKGHGGWSQICQVITLQKAEAGWQVETGPCSLIRWTSQPPPLTSSPQWGGQEAGDPR